MIKTTLENGTEGTYRTVSNKTLNIGGKTVEVTFKRINNRIFISDAWVQTRE